DGGPGLSAELALGISGGAIGADGAYYFAQYGDEIVRRLDLVTGILTTIAGQVNVGGTLDGIGTAALFDYPEGVAADAFGAIYVTDSMNSNLRKIDLGTLQVTTLATGLAGNANNPW